MAGCWTGGPFAFTCSRDSSELAGVTFRNTGASVTHPKQCSARGRALGHALLRPLPPLVPPTPRAVGFPGQTRQAQRRRVLSAAPPGEHCDSAEEEFAEERV